MNLDMGLTCSFVYKHQQKLTHVNELLPLRIITAKYYLCVGASPQCLMRAANRKREHSDRWESSMSQVSQSEMYYHNMILLDI